MSPTECRLAAGRLSVAMRDLLIEHVDRAVHFDADDGNRRKVILALVQRGLLSYGLSPAGGCDAIRPKHTRISQEGREVLCALLAEYADAIVRAGFVVEALLSQNDAPPREISHTAEPVSS